MRSPLVIAVALSVAACGNRHRENKEPPHDVQRRRMPEPNDRVGPLPPYAIRAEGVGPYRLGEKLSDLLEQLASGPRIALFDIPGVVHLNVIRAEDDAILIGGEQASTASLVAVVGSEVARTESGVHVGSTRDELVAALGRPSEDPERARDPRLVVPSSAPNIRAVLDGDRVAAIVVTSAPPPPRHVTDCQRPAATDKAMGACMTPAGELIEVGGGEVVIRSADGERTMATSPRFPGLVFAAPLRATEGRDELVVITRSDDGGGRSWSLLAYRLEGARLVRTIEAPLYQLSSANARWIGADLRDVDLYLELSSRSDGIEVGGLLTTRSASRTTAKIRDVVVISTTLVPRRRKSTAGEAGDASTAAAPQGGRPVSDAGANPAGAAGTESEAAKH